MKSLGGWLVLAVFGLGCQARIQTGLDERQANEISAALAERGITAKKVPEGGKKSLFAVEVESEQSLEAVRLLSELGLPRPLERGLRDVYGSQSLVPSPTEERARMMMALSGELARTLESIDGVLQARVHLVLPPPPRVGQPPAAPKASAFLRVRAGAARAIEERKGELAALVSGGIEGLAADAVTLVVHEAPRGSSLPARTEPNHLRTLAAMLGGLVTLVSLALAFLGLKLKEARQKLAAVAEATQPNLTKRAA